MQRLIDELHQHTDIKDIEDQIIQYAQNCQTATPPPKRQKPDCIEFVKGRGTQFLRYRPTPQEKDALTKLWRSHILVIVKLINRWSFNDEEKKDLLMESYELLQLAVSTYDSKRGSLQSFLFMKIKEMVNKAASHYNRRTAMFAVVRIEDLTVKKTLPTEHLSLNDFAKRVGVFKEFTELMDTAHDIYNRFV